MREYIFCNDPVCEAEVCCDELTDVIIDRDAEIKRLEFLACAHVRVGYPSTCDMIDNLQKKIKLLRDALDRLAQAARFTMQNSSVYEIWFDGLAEAENNAQTALSGKEVDK